MQKTKMKRSESPRTDDGRLQYEENDSSLGTLFWIGGFLPLTIALYLIGQGG